MPSLLMAGLAYCSESWMVGVPWGTGRKSLAGKVLSTLCKSCVCFEQILRLLLVCLALSISFSRGEHPGSVGRLEVR